MDVRVSRAIRFITRNPSDDFEISPICPYPLIRCTCEARRRRRNEIQTRRRETFVLLRDDAVHNTHIRMYTMYSNTTTFYHLKLDVGIISRSCYRPLLSTRYICPSLHQLENFPHRDLAIYGIINISSRIA